MLMVFTSNRPNLEHEIRVVVDIKDIETLTCFLNSFIDVSQYAD